MEHENEKKSWRDLFRKVPPKKWLMLAALGVVCLLMATYIEDMDSKNKFVEEDSGITQEKSENYGEKLEKRLEQVLSTVEGAGTVEVIITFVDSGEKVVNKDVSQSTSNVTEKDSAGGNRTSEESKFEEDTILSGSSGNGTPYVVQELTPTVLGVLVVSDGGDSPVVVEKITSAISALFGLSAHKITVLKRQK